VAVERVSDLGWTNGQVDRGVAGVPTASSHVPFEVVTLKTPGRGRVSKETP
jgi:hypothetical protein